MAAKNGDSSAELIRLSRDFYRHDAAWVARRLLGQELVHSVDGQLVSGMIVETEAYLGEQDKAAHSFGGRRTERTETMFADGGVAYVYLNYGIHNLFNIVTATVDQPQAVLIRAVQPTKGQAIMHSRRPKAKHATDLCSGPGKLSAAFGIDRSLNAVDLIDHPRLYVRRIRERAISSRRIAVAKRIGIDYAEEWADAPLRFFIADNPHVSVKKQD